MHFLLELRKLIIEVSFASVCTFLYTGNNDVQDSFSGKSHVRYTGINVLYVSQLVTQQT